MSHVPLPQAPAASIVDAMFHLLPSSPECTPPVTVSRCQATALRRALETELSSYNKAWHGSIPLSVSPHRYLALSDPDLSLSLFSVLDICRYLNGQQPLFARLYFDPRLYPPPAPGCATTLHAHEAGKRLKHDIMRSGHQNGSPLCTNGNSRQNNLVDAASCRFRCSSFRACQSIDPPKSDYRSTSLVADHRNQRANGRAL